MKYKIIYSNYDEISGESVVRVGTRFGNFEAKVKMREDEAYPSKYFGCNLAEIKALRKAEKAALRAAQSELKALTDYHNLLVDTWSYNDKDFHVRKLHDMMQQKREEIKVIKFNIAQLEKNYYLYIKQRDTQLDKLHKTEKEG